MGTIAFLMLKVGIDSDFFDFFHDAAYDADHDGVLDDDEQRLADFDFDGNHELDKYEERLAIFDKHSGNNDGHIDEKDLLAVFERQFGDNDVGASAAFEEIDEQLADALEAYTKATEEATTASNAANVAAVHEAAALETATEVSNALDIIKEDVGASDLAAAQQTVSDTEATFKAAEATLEEAKTEVANANPDEPETLQKAET